MTTTLTTNRAQEFVAAVQLGWESWMEAGRIVVEEIDKNPNFAKEVVVASKGQFTVETVRQFERIGRNELLPQLLLDYEKPGIKRLVRCPIAVQEKYANSPVEVLVYNEGKWDTLLVQTRNLTPVQTAQVFDVNEVRPVEAQRAWVESKKSKAVMKQPVVDGDPGYVIKNGTIIFTKPCSFSTDELLRIIINRK
jgi:hypothetical protein